MKSERKRKINKNLERCWIFFRVSFFCKKNLSRDAVVLAVLILALILFSVIVLGGGKNKRVEKVVPVEQPQQEVLSMEDIFRKEQESIVEVQSRFNTSPWRAYRNNWYGFLLKYPEIMKPPVLGRFVAGDLWEQNIQFLLRDSGQDNPFLGFAVVIYNVSKIKELSATEEFPKLKSEAIMENPECASFDGRISENDNFPAEQIYVSESDSCYQEALFFTNTKGNYIYNITPILKEEASLNGDVAQQIQEKMPEFFAVVSTWELVDIVRPKPKPPAPKVTAPMPVSFKMENGRRVCDKKNDHPSKSKQHKGKHLDMECCLDPDEYPNPNCYYPPSKYGKYLK